MTAAVRAVLFTRFPVAGQAKTRLIPAVGSDKAALIHRELTERTVETLRRSETRIEIACTGGDKAQFSDWLGDDLHYRKQCDGDLTARLLECIDPAPVIFFGSDTPDLSREIVNEAVAALRREEVVIGPAEDGGYYLIGMAVPHRWLFTDMPWSSEKVFPETLARLKQRGIGPYILPALSDCDRPEDLRRWPWLTK